MHARLVVLLLAGLAACSPAPLLSGDASPDDVLDAAAVDGGAETDSGQPAPVVLTPVALWELPRGAPGAFTLPWPNDLARHADGTVNLGYFPNPTNNSLVAQYVRALDGKLDGFSTMGAVYLRFGMPLDTNTLPGSPAASREAASTVQLVDVDPMSPERGRRTPVQWHFRERATRYWGANTLAVAPVFGFPLRPATRYALVVTTGARGAGGRPLERDVDLQAVLRPEGGDAAVAAARTRYAPALEALASAGVAPESVLSLAVFTTQDPTGEFFRVADWLRERGPAPELIDTADATPNETFWSYHGHYGPNPVFQSGRAPYNEPGSGGFVFDPATGAPLVQGTERIAFTLTIPTGPMPERGWPVVIYAHGTGGNRDSFIRDRTAQALSGGARVAVLGFDQIFHGERAVAGVTPDTAFFNFNNPQAGRTNNRQAALDLVQAGRFVRRVELELMGTGGMARHRFDPANVMFFGHSQGGLNGPLWLAAEDGARAAVLSGAAGSLAISLTLKTEPVDIPVLLRQALGAETGEVVALHPVVTLAQTIADCSDPVNYARYIVREPRPGMHAKHVFQTQGFVDRYAPPAGIAALALATGLPLGTPVGHPEPAYPLTGLAEQTLPARANLVNNTVTGLWMQFDAPARRDGHFVVFDVPGARLRAAAFLGSAARDGTPSVPLTVE